MQSPVCTIRQLMMATYLALVLSLLVDARSIVRDAGEMPDGIMHSATLLIGHTALRLADPLHLTWPRDRLDIALGSAPQPAIPPLLQAGPDIAPSPAALPARGSTSTIRQIAALVTLPAALAQRRPGRQSMDTPAASAIGATDHLVLRGQLCRHVERYSRVPRSGEQGIPWKSDSPHRSGTSNIQFARMTRAPAAAAKPLPLTATAAPFVPASPTSSTTATPVATALPGPSLRPITAQHPLRLLVTGDSMIEYLGPDVVDLAGPGGKIRGSVDIHYGTGLARPDFVDWSVVAQQQAATYHPDAVVVLLGGNDAQNMVLANGQIVYQGTPQWLKEYRRRARICMQTWLRGGVKRVYWLSMPPARSSIMAATESQIDVALREAAATVPGVHFLNIVGLVTSHGAYADALLVHGQWIYVREPDGVHLSPGGAQLVAQAVLPVLRREWHLTAH